MSKSIWKTGTPKKSGRYAVITKYNRITCIDFSKNHNLWNASDRDTETRAKELAIEKEYIKYYTSPKELIELVEAEIEAEKIQILKRTMKRIQIQILKRTMKRIQIQILKRTRKDHKKYRETGKDKS